MFRDLADGFNSYFKVLPAIGRFGLIKYFVLSGLISLAIGALLFGSIYYAYDDLGAWLADFYRWEFGRGYFEKATNWIAGLIIGALALLSYKYILLIVLSPILSVMSDKVESGLVGEPNNASVSISSFVKDMIRGIGITFRNIFRELFLTLVLLVLGLFPAFSLFTGIAMLLVQAYYAGFGNMDYYLERHFNIKDSSRFVKRYKGLAIANGGIFIMLLLIPVVGLLIAPTFSTIASSLEVHKRVYADDVNL